MAKTKISEYSSTANSNTDIASINIDEGCAPSGINNAIRALMAQLKDFQTGAAGDPVTVGDVLTVKGASINDTNGNEIFKLTATASAVNELTIANAATGGSPTISATGGDTNIGINLTPKGTGGVVFPAGAVGTPSITTSGDLNTGVYFPVADTVGVTTGGTERVRVDSSGNVGIGTSASTYNYQIKNIALYDASSAGISIVGGAKILTLTAQSTGGIFVGSRSNDNLIFATNDTERARIDTSGNLLVGYSGASNYRMWVAANAATYSAYFANANAAPYGLYIQHSAASPNSASNEFIACWDSTAARFVVRSNGGIANYSANNVNLSDSREKTNVNPAGDYLAKICSIPIRTYNYIDQNLEEDAGLTLGVFAQDVQSVAPELVTESNWGTEEEPKMRLSIYQTDMQYALMKCIQEQQAIIEQLRSDVEALKAA